MNTQKQTSNQPFVGKHDENILVVKRNDLFPHNSAWNGIRAIEDKNFLETILAKKEFLPRSLMETDYNYKQVIPYLVFEHNNRYFLMHRKAKASDTRLQSKFSLGIGGHIRETDIQGSDILQWAEREFNEEVDYDGSFTIEAIGIINDDTNDVGRVHVGFVYLLHGTSDSIQPKEEFQGAQLLSLDACQHYYDRMESWSQIVFNFLKTC